MEKGKNCLWKTLGSSMEEERGVVLVEASFVLPIVFFVLIFLIYLGNIFYIQSRIEGIAARAALRGAAACGDPLLAKAQGGGNIAGLSPGEIDIDPYRYLFGNSGSHIAGVKQRISQEIQGELNSGNKSFFSKMGAKVYINKVQYNNFLVYSTFSVELGYSIDFPIRFIFVGNTWSLQKSVYAEVALQDTTEFIRNTDMVIDMFAGTEMGKKVKNVFGKVNTFIKTFSGK